MTSTASESLAHRIARQLEDDILHGRRTLGERLDERDLAEHFEASRTPVREALQRLASSGLVTLNGRSGARVARLTLSQLLDAFYVVAELEAISAEQAARRITAEQVEKLGEYQARCEEACEAGDVPAFYDNNYLFHDGILEASGNWMLREQMRSARLLTPYRRQITFQPGRMLSSIREHEDILDAIRNGDHERAASLMRKHVNTLAIGVSDFLHYLERSGTQEILAPS